MAASRPSDPWRMPTLAGENILPSQFYPTRTTAPEKKLVWALLENVWDRLKRYNGLSHRRAARIYQEELDWVLSDARSGEGWFSFVDVCESLGIDPECLRQGMLAKLASYREGESTPPAGRRIVRRTIKRIAA